MSKESRLLQPGARVRTDYSGKVTEHEIINRTTGQSQSGIMFLLRPIVPKSSGGWIDADWFEPVETKESHHG